MKIFLDTANRDQIKKMNDLGVIDGVTTNPTLLSKENSDVKGVLGDICKLVSGPVSIEVTEKDPDSVYKQAKDIVQIAKNVVVKIPCVAGYFPVIDKLVKEGVKINVTLVFSELQALLVAKLGVAFISPFIGRLDDIGVAGITSVENIVKIKQNYNFKSEIIAASIRNVDQLKRVALVGVDVATVPASVIEQAIKHPLTDIGVSMFDEDWNKLQKVIGKI